MCLLVTANMIIIIRSRAVLNNFFFIYKRRIEFQCFLFVEHPFFHGLIYVHEVNLRLSLVMRKVAIFISSLTTNVAQLRSITSQVVADVVKTITGNNNNYNNTTLLYFTITEQITPSTVALLNKGDHKSNQMPKNEPIFWLW